jgi:acyl carrier protein
VEQTAIDLIAEGVTMTKLDNSGDIRERLIERISSALNVHKSDVDADAPFSRYALDSMDSVTLVMDLEEQLGMDLPPTLLWDYPTVNKCVSYLVVQREGQGTSSEQTDLAAVRAFAV